jgi:LPS-assembly protein
MKKQLLFFSVILFSGLIHANQICHYPQSPLLKKQSNNDTKRFNIEADEIKIIKKDNYVLKNNAVINSDKYFLSADFIEKSNNFTIAKDNIKLQDEQVIITGDQVTIQEKTNTINIEAEKAQLIYPDNEINIKADKLVSSNGKQKLTSAVYNLCPLGNDDWQIDANQIIIDEKNNKGYAKNAKLKFLGIPFFYLPYYEWTLKGRASGFLNLGFSKYKELSDNSSSYQIKIPYYFNIAKDRDFLLTLNRLSSRGNVIEGKYRQLIAKNNYLENGAFETQGSYLKKDYITNDKRWLFKSKANIKANDKINFSANFNKISDKNYLKDIEHDNTSNSLYSDIHVSYKDKNDLELSIFAEKEQLVNNGIEDYTTYPKISMSKIFKVANDTKIKTSFTSTKFKHKNANTTTNKTASRNNLILNFEKYIKNKSYSIKSNINFYNSYYSIDNLSNENRNVASFSIDSKLFLEKNINKNFKQTLTPRLFYRFSQKKAQGDIPIFDTKIKDSFYQDLFSNKGFIGTDRIINANDLVIGLESSFINKKTGNANANFKIGQAFYADEEVVSDKVDVSGIGTDYETRRKYSNIASVANFRINDKLKFNNRLQFDPEINKITSNNNYISYKLNSRKFLTIGYNNNDNDESVEFYGSYPINDKMHFFGLTNKSITNSITNKQILGIGYENCCLIIRVANFKERVDNNNYDSITLFEFLLKSFTSEPTSFEKKIRQNIPNYS